MHTSSMLRMKWFIDNYVEEGKRVLDVGSYDVNGNYRGLFAGKNIEYVGLDIEAGPNVDIVMDEPYSWHSIEDESFDYIISGQAFEHIEYPWLTIKEIYKKLKMGGIICVTAPNSTREHRYPYDCYRYFSDGLAALAKWAGFKVLDVSVSGIPERNVSPDWYNEDNDALIIAIKSQEEPDLDKYPRFKYERRFYGLEDQRLRYEFLGRWVGQKDFKNKFVDRLNRLDVEYIYVYGNEWLGKVVYEDLKQSCDKKVEIINGSKHDLNPKSIMLVTLLDYCRDFKLYLDTIYKNISKEYIDELAEIYEIREYFKKHKNVYIYGAGVAGRRNKQLMEQIGLFPKGFVVSCGERKAEEYEGLPVCEIQEMQCDEETGIIIAVKDKFKDEITDSLKEYGVKDYIYGNHI